jgi:GT2 family glycosyltransferase
MEKQNSVSIIIVNWNQKKALATCLSSLKNKTAYVGYDVIVVDNGSSDGSVQLVKEKFPWADIITLNKNYGFSIGNNKGIVYALKKNNPAYVLLLNNDTEIVQNEWLSKMVTVAEGESNVGIVGCKLIYPGGKTQYIGTKINVKGLTWINPSTEGNLTEVFDVDAVLGACFLIKKEVIDKIGFLDVGFSPFFHEESDFCVRAKKAGYRTCMVLSVCVVHFWKMSVGKVNSEYIEYIVRRNAIRFMLLNFPTKWLLMRVPVEARVFVSFFIARSLGKRRILPIRLRTGEELLGRLKLNVYAWLHNLRNLQEILNKRRSRTVKL